MDKTPAAKQKQPRKISAKYLENAALYYLQRYASSAENLRRVLTRKVQKSCTFHKMPPEEFYPVIDTLIRRYVSSGLLDDNLYARGRAASLRRQGLSKQAIAAKLQIKGLSRPQIDQALAEIDAEKGEDAELQAALALARRKKIGRFRTTPDADQKTRQKELAAMGRAGFSYETASRALDYTEEDDFD